MFGEKDKFNLSVRFSKDEEKIGRIRQGLQTEYEKKIRELVRFINRLLRFVAEKVNLSIDKTTWIFTSTNDFKFSTCNKVHYSRINGLIFHLIFSQYKILVALINVIIWSVSLSPKVITLSCFHCGSKYNTQVKSKKNFPWKKHSYYKRPHRTFR